MNDVKAIETFVLTKKYGDTVAVDGLDLTVYKGELFSLLGINGAGKTTTLKMLMCLIPPTSGDAFLNGKSIKTEDSEIKKIIAVSPQENAIAQNLTVFENLELIAGIHGGNKNKNKYSIREKVEKISEDFRLSSILSKRAGKLSGGWQRRLSIAMALISEPEILFLDEPSLGLDVIARSELWENIRSLKGKVTVVLTTHYMEEAEALSDRIGIMKNGKMIITGTADEIKLASGKDKLEDAFVSVVTEELKK